MKKITAISLPSILPQIYPVGGESGGYTPEGELSLQFNCQHATLGRSEARSIPQNLEFSVPPQILIAAAVGFESHVGESMLELPPYEFHNVRRIMKHRVEHKEVLGSGPVPLESDNRHRMASRQTSALHTRLPKK